MKTASLPKNRLNGDHDSDVILNGDPKVAEAQAKQEKEVITVLPLRLKVLHVVAVGTAPFMQLRFSAKAIAKMRATHEAGSQGKSKKNREKRDFDDDYKQAFHLFPDGTPGIPAAAIRAACISACRTCGFKMTVAKLSVFCLADGLDIVDGAPLIRIYGTPEQTVMPVRNASGVTDLRVRPLWRAWKANIRIRFDEDQFSAGDAFNLLARAGAQVGIGEGRPDSKESCGMGYGTFDIYLPDDAPSDEQIFGKK